MMGGKFPQKLEVLIPWMLLKRNFLNANLLDGKISRLKFFPNCLGIGLYKHLPKQ
jgi:hypothetical protein